MRQLITGIVDYTLDFVECKCPSAYPDLDASDSALCTDGSSTAARFNTTVHFNRPEVMLDEKTETRWASSETGIITLTLDLGRSFQVHFYTLLQYLYTSGYCLLPFFVEVLKPILALKFSPEKKKKRGLRLRGKTKRVII